MFKENILKYNILIFSNEYLLWDFVKRVLEVNILGKIK